MNAKYRKPAGGAASESPFVWLDGTATPPRRGQVGLVPGAAAPILDLDLPQGLRGPGREKVAQRLLQDQVGLGPEAVQLRPVQLGQVGRDGWSRVLVAAASQIAGWRALAGPDCRAVLPDYLALPAAEDVWSVQAQGAVFSARLGPGDGFSAELPLADVMLAQKLRSAPPRAILVLGDMPASIQSLLVESGLPLLQSPEEAGQYGLDAPRILSHGEEQLDLRRDPQAARDAMRRKVLPWRLPVLLGVVAGVVWAMALMLETRSLSRQAAADRAAAQAITREAFVPSGPILDIRAQATQALADLQSRVEAQRRKTSSLDLFARAAEVLERNAGSLDAVRYSGGSALDLRLRVDSFAALDALVEALDAASLTVEITQSRLDAEAQAVEVDLRLTPRTEAPQ